MIKREFRRFEFFKASAMVDSHWWWMLIVSCEMQSSLVSKVYFSTVNIFRLKSKAPGRSNAKFVDCPWTRHVRIEPLKSDIPVSRQITDFSARKLSVEVTHVCVKWLHANDCTQAHPNVHLSGSHALLARSPGFHRMSVSSTFNAPWVFTTNVNRP